MDKHRKSGGDIFSDCLPRCVISPSAVMLTRSLFDALGGFDEQLPACEDYDLWLRICHQQEVAYLEEPLLKKYGGHEDQLSRKHWGMDRFRVRALEKLLEQPTLDDDQRRETVAMLRQKCAVLIAGAEKRGNEELMDYCRNLSEKYGN